MARQRQSDEIDDSPLGALLPLWSFGDNPSGALDEGPVIAGDRVLFVAGGELHALDMYTGASVVPVAPAGATRYPLTVDQRGKALPCAAGGAVYWTNGKTLNASRLADGAPLWSRPGVGRMTTLLAVGGRVIGVSTSGGTTSVSGYDMQDGSRLFAPVSRATGSSGVVAVSHDALFFVAAGALTCVNINGDERWRFAPTGQQAGLESAVAPVVVPGDTAGDGVVLVAGSKLYAVSLATGAVRWTIDPPTDAGVIWYPPVLSDSGRSLVVANSAEAIGLTLSPTSTDAAPSSASTEAAPIAWRAPVASRARPIALGDDVALVSGRGLEIRAAADGKVQSIVALPAGAGAPVVAGTSVVLPGPAGGIDAWTFGRQNAALFDGKASRIDISADRGRFDFGTDDFTIEAWFRSSVGGEIISSYPTAGDGCGVRLNVTADGAVQALVAKSGATTADLAEVNAGRTAGTHAADGQWHHVALVRRSGTFLMLVDGLSRQVFAPTVTGPTNSITGQSALTIGAWRDTARSAPASHFRGLIREVRVWGKALEATVIAENRRVALTGKEPALRGLWSLNEYHDPHPEPDADPVVPTNAVPRHGDRATFVNPASALSELAMDTSLFPYLLQEAAPQWPYAGAWAVRGQLPVVARPAMSSTGVLAFATNNALYGVRNARGERLWTIDAPRGSSPPVPDGSYFLAMTGAGAVIRIDSLTGNSDDVAGFEAVSGGEVDDLGEPAPGEVAPRLAAPAASNGYLAGAHPDRPLVIAPRTLPPGVSPLKIPPAALHDLPVRRMEFGAFGLAVVASLADDHELFVVDPAAGPARAVKASVKMSSDVIAVHATSIFCMKGGSLTRLDAGAGLAARATLDRTGLSGRVTGLACWPDSDLLVATTDDGHVHGLTLSGLAVRWTIELPVVAGGAKAVNPPVFDSSGNIFCTTAGGMVVALTPEDGTVAGLYQEAQPIVTSAVVRDGVAYYACAEAANPEVDVDGALHSMVFGQLLSLRAGLDVQGGPSSDPVHAVVVAAREDCTLSLLHEPLLDDRRGSDPDMPEPDAELPEGEVDIWMQSCVEAWVNIPPGRGPADSDRGLFAICPSTSDHAFDIRLSIRADGGISYVTRSRRDGAWTQLAVRTDDDAGLCDGRWHHVAVSRKDATEASVFVDAKLVPAPAVVSTVAEPPTRDPGLKAFIGATFDDALEATAPFRGLVAEVRVWDASRDAAEIAKLRLVKLRGDEASLLACWNFDFGEVHDMARQGHDGHLVGPRRAAAWWLSQLSFEQPSYPHVISQGTLEAEGDPDVPSPAGDARYLLGLTVLDAAGKGMSDHALRLWYVRHRDDEPASIFVTSGAAERELVGIDPWTSGRGPQPVRAGDSAAFVDLTTGVAGTAKVKVRTGFGHGPGLDVRAAFMPANQRFHVSCLADKQELVKPTPPTLNVQSRLIQDYHYMPGSPVDEKSGRSTHRVVITAVNADLTLRPDEEITLWSAAPMTVEVAGTTRSLTPENPVIARANAQGECVVVVDADALTTPAMYAKAGFMHKDERIVIAPDADAARQLAALDDDTLTKPKLTAWKPNAKASDATVLLPPEKRQHATKIASAVHKVMTSAVPDHRVRAGRRSALLAAARPNVRPSLEHMHQPERPPIFDDASAVRSLAGAEVSPMASPDAFRAALGGDLGFEFAWDQGTGTLTYRALTSPAEVALAFGPPTPPEPGVQGWLDDMWSEISTVATDIYEGAKSLVIIIGEQIEVAIKYLDEHVVQVVVETVKDAVNAVVGFFKQLVLAIEQIIAFLRALFDWDAIIGAAHQVKAMLYRGADALPELVKPVKKVVGDLVDSVEDWLGIDRHGAAASSIAALEATPGNRDAVGHADGVEAKSMRQKVDDNSGGMRLPGGLDTIGDWPPGSDLLRPVQEGISDMFGDLASLDFAALGDHLAALFKRVAEAALENARDWINASLDGFADSLRIMLDALDRPMHIPFVSELYKWATGDELTILNLATLLIGFPVHVVYTIVTGGRRFCDDAAHWFTPHGQLTAGGGSSAAADPSLGAVLDTTSKGLEVTYVILRWTYSAYTFSADVSFSRKGNSDWRSFCLSVSGLSGAATAFIGNITLAHYERLLTKHEADDTDVGHQFLRWGPTAVSLLVDLRGLYKGCKALAANSAVVDIDQPIARRDGSGGGIPNPSTPGGRIDPEWTDTAEFYLLSLNAILGIVIIGFAIAHIVDGAEFSEGTNKDADLRTAARLFAAQGIAMTLPKLPAPFFTHSRAGDLLESNPELKVGLAVGRFAANLAALTCHGIAAFGYMDLEW